MYRLIKNTLLLTLLLSAAAWRPVSNTSAQAGDYLNVVQTAGSSMAMDWSVSGTGSYSVSVVDLNTGQRVAGFTTTNTSATVGGIVSGHTYRFSVSSGTNIVIIDVLGL